VRDLGHPDLAGLVTMLVSKYLAALLRMNDFTRATCGWLDQPLKRSREPVMPTPIAIELAGGAASPSGS
jgi:hypothetical protein